MPWFWDWGVSGGEERGVSWGGREGAEKCDEGGKVELVRCVHMGNGTTGKEEYWHSGKACDAAMGGGRGPSDAK